MQTNIKFKHEAALIFLLLVVTAAAAFWRAPPGAVFSADPPALQSYAKYVYLTDLHTNMLRESGDYWGYDPTFAAGIITGAGWYVAYLLPAVFSLLTSLSGAIVIKLYLLAYFLLSPLLIYLAARLWRFSPGASLVAGLITLLLDQTTLRAMAVMKGMVASSFAVPLIIATAAWVWRINDERPRPWHSLLVVLFATALIGQINPNMVLPLAIALIGIWLIHRRQFFRFGPLVGAGAVCLLLFLFFWPWARTGIEQAKAIGSFLPIAWRITRMEWQFFHSWGVFILLAQPLVIWLIITAIIEFGRWRRRKTLLGLYLGGLCLTMLLAAVALVAFDIGYAVFPNKYLNQFIALLAFPAASWVHGFLTGFTPKKRKFFLGALAIVILLAQVFVIPETKTRLKTANQSEDFRKLVRWISDETAGDARILVESSHNSETQPLGFDFAGLLPQYIPRREFIALPNTESLSLVYPPWLCEGVLNFLPIESFSDDELVELIRLYHIGWLVVSHPVSKRRLDQAETVVERIGRVGPFDLYRSRRETSLFLTGNGTVFAKPNQILLDNLEPDEQGNVVLSYHWFDTLVAEQNVKISAYTTPMDPYGLIALHNPPRRVVIVHRSERGFPHVKKSLGEFTDRLVARAHELGIQTDVPAGSGLVYEHGAGTE